MSEHLAQRLYAACSDVLRASTRADAWNQPPEVAAPAYYRLRAEVLRRRWVDGPKRAELNPLGVRVLERALFSLFMETRADAPTEAG